MVTPLSLIQPFAALRPAPGRAPEVAAPPYDVVSTAEALALSAGRPWSFLHVSRPEIGLPAGADPHGPAAYQRAREALAAMVAAGVLARDTRPALYAYRLRAGAHSQTGLVAAAAVAAYDTGRIRRHEHTRPDKEDDRVRHVEAVAGHTGPVLLAHPDTPAVDKLLAEASAGEPDQRASTPDGVEHALWVIGDPAREAALVSAFEAMPALYIADGHHRSAAASRVAASRRALGAAAGDVSQRFLVVSFPRRQLRILAYHRVVRDLGGRTREAFLEALGARFTLQAEPGAVEPSRPGEFGLRLPGQWFRLALAPDRIPADPVAGLDTSLLATEALEPVLGITDPRTDPRIDFVGGSRGSGELERRVDGGEFAAAFALRPTPLDALMAVADAGRVMPPKSTWFDPKLADGMACLMLDH